MIPCDLSQTIICSMSNIVYTTEVIFLVSLSIFSFFGISFNWSPTTFKGSCLSFFLLHYWIIIKNIVLCSLKANKYWTNLPVWCESYFNIVITHLAYLAYVCSLFYGHVKFWRRLVHFPPKGIHGFVEALRCQKKLELYIIKMQLIL